MYDFLKFKKKDESLDKRWIEIWEELKQYAQTEVPERIFKYIDNQINSIHISDEEIFKIRINNSTGITILLGAGASAPSGIPTVDKLLDELWKRARMIGREDLDRLAEWCEERKIKNIEDLLTSAYIANFAAKNSSITSLLDYFLFSPRKAYSEEEEEEEEYITRSRATSRKSEIDVSSISFLQDTLQTLFGLLTSTMIAASPNPVHDSIVEFAKKHKNISIITTNYDGCMDEAFLKSGIVLKSTLTINDGKKAENAVELIKMHGSINWAYCDSCQDVREFDLIKMKNAYKKDILSYPLLGICKKCEGLRRPLLVPPLSFKFVMFPTLVGLWDSARQCIEDSEYLIIIGYSFAEADTYITNIIFHSMSMNKNQKIIIVNTNLDLVHILRKRFSVKIDGFNEKRILNSSESCDKILPNILKSMIGEATLEKGSKEKISKKPRKK
jgi:NAD-dependent SIR2 family protein deacetylase